MTLFTVVVPTCNRAALLREALDSVLTQTFTDFEVIVVDDGSTDETPSVVAGYGDRVRSYRQANRGPGAARNLGAAHAKGDYLAFLDSDDLWFPWTLGTYHRLLEQHDHPAFLAGKPLRFRGEGGPPATAPAPSRAVTFPDYLASGDEWRWWGASSFVIRGDVFGLAAGFREDFVVAEDSDLALRLGTAPGFVQVLSPATFAYREHGGNLTKDFSKTLGATWLSVQAERAGRYPGGTSRARERRQILTRHARPVALGCLRRGMRREGWGLYRAMFRWHVSLGRWKFLAGFPLAAAGGLP